MPRNQTRSRPPANGWIALALAACLLAPALAPAQTPTPVRMRALLDALAEVLPLGLNEATFSDPRHRETIRQNLDVIAANGNQLQEHGTPYESRAFNLISGELATDAESALDRFDNGDFEDARFLVGRLTNYCFACHSRLPASAGPELGAEFLGGESIRSLSLRDQMTLAVTARRFDLAMVLGEQLLLDKKRSPEELDLEGVPEDYLKIMLRVRGNASRAGETFRRFGERKDMPVYLAYYVNRWVEDLGGIALDAYDHPRLETAKSWIEEGMGANEYPADRLGLVPFIAASGLLHQVTETQPEVGVEAEAYLLLGIVETTISGSPWPPEADFYLESAIRLAPGTPTALEAYRVLEEHVLGGCMGTSGIHMPPETRERLARLRAIAEGT